ncbi:MAG: hypothetical protein Q7R49_02965 [Candidatus Daviesbacteria bacterium]|nr:hypothetical protein [Candidatus Daviesbacteria bacterium]
MDNIDFEEIKAILGDKSSQMSYEDLQDSIIKMQYLIELWLDSFEREIFEGKSFFEMLASNIL